MSPSVTRSARTAAGKLKGLALIESRYTALLPLNTELHDEWAVRVAFYTRAATTPTMQKLLSQHYDRDLRAGVRDLKEAHRAPTCVRRRRSASTAAHDPDGRPRAP